MGVKAQHGEKMIEVKLRFWTNDIAEKEGEIIPKHARTAGVVGMEPNKTHGFTSGGMIHFHSLLDIGAAIEKLLINNDIKLLPSSKMEKYIEQSI